MEYLERQSARLGISTSEFARDLIRSKMSQTDQDQVLAERQLAYAGASYRLLKAFVQTGNTIDSDDISSMFEEAFSYAKDSVYGKK